MLLGIYIVLMVATAAFYHFGGGFELVPEVGLVFLVENGKVLQVGFEAGVGFDEAFEGEAAGGALVSKSVSRASAWVF